MWVAARRRATGFDATGWLSARQRELRDIPQAVKVLGEELVLFRDDNGARRFTRPTLPAPRRVPGVWRYRRRRDSLSLSWLAVRRRRPLLGHAGGGRRNAASPQKCAICPIRFGSRAVCCSLIMGTASRSSAAIAGYLAAGQRGRAALARSDSSLYNYNWFNFIENGADPAHFSILHRADPNDGTWRSWFFNFRDIPPFDAIEMPYGMKVMSRKPGPNADSEYVDEKSFALPSILQIGDTEFTHFKASARSARAPVRTMPISCS